MQTRPCPFDGWQDADAPRVRLLQGLDADRDMARRQVRAALQACLALELGCARDELRITSLRGQPPQVLRCGQPLAAPYCSISHAPGLALLAWRWQAPIGVDIQALDSTMPRGELEDVARLFLEPDTARMLARIVQDAHFFKVFATAWTWHEARLKCAGLGLVEWSAALGGRLAGMGCAEVALGAGHGAAVAWRVAAHSLTESPACAAARSTARG